jgi:hypothetical protein
MTLDAAIVSLRNVFEFGQGYVAVSRMRSLSALCIDDDPRAELPWFKIFRAHPEAIQFYANLSQSRSSLHQHEVNDSSDASADSAVPAETKFVRQPASSGASSPGFVSAASMLGIPSEGIRLVHSR